MSDDLEKLVKYLGNLGTYLGYDLTADVPQGPSPSKELLNQELLNIDAMKVMQNYLFNTMLGAIPVNTFTDTLKKFVPDDNQNYSSINTFANYTFSNPAYDSAGSQQSGAVTVNKLIDQPSGSTGFQKDPVSQAVLNILSTPNYTYCMNNAATDWIPGCPVLTSLKLKNVHEVMENVIGPLPATATDFFNPDKNLDILSQLNGNTLIAPLLYSIKTDDQSNTTTQATQKGLSAKSQAEQAANFIRYVTGAVAPLTLPTRADYEKLLDTASANTLTNTPPTAAQKLAQSTLDGYLTSLRVYAAQSSVGFGNLYYILSKRMPQNESTSGKPLLTSQALSEFTMATWRLYNPVDSTTPNKQWIDQIDKASAATVQKEMVTLLAEINYQLYLNRQQDERLLLTNTILLLQNARAAQPSSSQLTNGGPPQ